MSSNNILQHAFAQLCDAGNQVGVCKVYTTAKMHKTVSGQSSSGFFSSKGVLLQRGLHPRLQSTQPLQALHQSHQPVMLTPFLLHPTMKPLGSGLVRLVQQAMLLNQEMIGLLVTAQSAELPLMAALGQRAGQGSSSMAALRL